MCFFHCIKLFLRFKGVITLHICFTPAVIQLFIQFAQLFAKRFQLFFLPRNRFFRLLIQCILFGRHLLCYFIMLLQGLLKLCQCIIPLCCQFFS